MSSMPILSIITATYNADKLLPNLIASLRAQTCKDFEWVVADGASTDNTIKILSEVKDINIKVSSKEDFGIYDALNRAIKLASGKYYIVIGADDYFYEKTIENILSELKIDQSVELLIGSVESNKKLIKIRHGQSFLYGAAAFVSSHSVGCVINKDLHSRYGYYSNKYPILADTYFIKKIFRDSKLRYKYSHFVYGNFSSEGKSHTSLLRAQCELLHIQLTTEKFKFIQLIVVFFRMFRILLKNQNSD